MSGTLVKYPAIDPFDPGPHMPGEPWGGYTACSRRHSCTTVEGAFIRVHVYQVRSGRHYFKEFTDAREAVTYQFGWRGGVVHRLETVRKPTAEVAP